MEDALVKAITSPELKAIPDDFRVKDLPADWKNEKPYQLASRTYTWLLNRGIEPDGISDECVKWNLDLGGFEFDVKITDHVLPHMFPGPHLVYAWIGVKMEIPPERIGKVMKLTASLKYNDMGKKLWAGCGTFGATLAMLFYAKLVAEGKKRLSHARQELPSMIKVMIEEEKKGYSIFDVIGEPGPYHQAILEYI